jgi:gliding motility-associated transport system permease protein
MQEYCTLTRRELSGFFLSLIGYVVMAAAAFLVGLIFVVMVLSFGGDSTPMPLTELFFNTWFFWMIPLITIPVITMRLFALEKFSGTYETLMTTPVSDRQVVLAKFTAAILFYTIMWLPLLGAILILQHYGGMMASLDLGALGSTFLGIVLLGGLFLSFGCVASSLTRNQVIAAIMSLAFNLSLSLLSVLAGRVPEGDWAPQVLSYFALSDQMHDFARGVVDTRSIIFCLSLTFFFLFITLRIVESRRWK